MCTQCHPDSDFAGPAGSGIGFYTIRANISAITLKAPKRPSAVSYLKQADAHTLLRLPTGILIRSHPLTQCSAFRLVLCSQQIHVYAQGVKANGLVFDRKPAAEKPWTDKLWIYDLRTNKHFTLKENPLNRTSTTSPPGTIQRIATSEKKPSDSKVSATKS
jgi:hypothetical protein